MTEASVAQQADIVASPGNGEFEPKIVGFLCNWCSYAGADKAGTAQTPYPPNVLVVRVMCSGRVEPEFVMEAFKRGADGVMILACHPGDCHYKEGNYRAIQRHRILIALLEQMGIPKERCTLDFVSAGEGEKFVRVITETVAAIKKLGPLHISQQ
jgi:F420-non-reducing hydrogenase iron-sulfur subunit